jgi:hypothetical protein
MTSLNELMLDDFLQHMLLAIQRIEGYIEEQSEVHF